MVTDRWNTYDDQPPEPTKAEEEFAVVSRQWFELNIYFEEHYAVRFVAGVAFGVFVLLALLIWRLR